MKINKENMKFVFICDKDNERFIICEETYELIRYFVLEYDESRVGNGIGPHLLVTLYTTVSTNWTTSVIGRGQRGLDIDTKEFQALRNIIHFNCYNPFGCSCSKNELSNQTKSQGQG